jgi:hypothetical protein
MIFSEPRGPRFITIRRGGRLTDDNHHILAVWAAHMCGVHPAPLRVDEAFGLAAASRN